MKLVLKKIWAGKSQGEGGFLFSGLHWPETSGQIPEYIGVSWVVLVAKNLPANAGDARDAGSIPGLGRCPGGGHGNPLQCSCLENPRDRGAWRAMVHDVTESNTTEAT